VNTPRLDEPLLAENKCRFTAASFVDRGGVEPPTHGFSGRATAKIMRKQTNIGHFFDHF